MFDSTFRLVTFSFLIKQIAGPLAGEGWVGALTRFQSHIFRSSAAKVVDGVVVCEEQADESCTVMMPLPSPTAILLVNFTGWLGSV